MSAYRVDVKPLSLSVIGPSGAGKSTVSIVNSGDSETYLQHMKVHKYGCRSNRRGAPQNRERTGTVHQRSCTYPMHTGGRTKSDRLCRYATISQSRRKNERRGKGHGEKNSRLAKESVSRRNLFLCAKSLPVLGLGNGYESAASFISTTAPTTV